MVKTVGDAMVNTLASIEKKMYADQVAVLDELKPLSTSATEPLEELKAEEEKGQLCCAVGVFLLL